MTELGVICRFRPSANAEWGDSFCHSIASLLHRLLRRASATTSFFAFAFLSFHLVSAQAPATQAPAVAQKQIDVTERYRRLEELLLRLADLETEENPERAALLRRAAKQSRDTFVLEKMQEAGTSLKAEQFAKAIENQTNAREGVNRLLELLLSEDRPSESAMRRSVSQTSSKN